MREAAKGKRTLRIAPPLAFERIRFLDLTPVLLHDTDLSSFLYFLSLFTIRRSRVRFPLRKLLNSSEMVSICGLERVLINLARSWGFRRRRSSIISPYLFRRGEGVIFTTFEDLWRLSTNFQTPGSQPTLRNTLSFLSGCVNVRLAQEIFQEEIPVLILPYKIPHVWARPLNLSTGMCVNPAVVTLYL